MENDKLFFVMCIFACLLNSRRKESTLLILRLQRKNTLPDSLMSIFKEILKLNTVGMTLVPIKIDDDLQDENSKLRALISNNFGRRKNNPVKDRKALATYVELKGYKHGEIGNGRKKTYQNGTSEKSIRDKIAKELKICQLRWN